MSNSVHHVPELPAEAFDSFFENLHQRRPFQWQSRLAAQACDGVWPRIIQLPTSSGKTSCIDVAVFSLAHQAWRHHVSSQTINVARRIFFVVDRRVIVNEAYCRALAIGERLKTVISNEETTSPIYAVAWWLRSLTRNENSPPLDCFELRGGIYRDDAWVRSVLQPTVLTSTVDQIGSRLLFRGYGVSDRNLPIHAALAANDSLILLDEAHCSKPFSQTMASIARYRDAQLLPGQPPRWAEEPIITPFHFVEMTATPNVTTATRTLRLDDADYAADPLLQQRHGGSKPVRLVESNASGKDQNRKLAKHLVAQAVELASGTESQPGCRRIAIVVNRVACAREAYEELRVKHGRRAHLMIGRMRPLDRDRLTSQLTELFCSGSKQELTEPHYVVATQCLEVGADFDFDGMVCQCASLDALRQRFGRLNRLGRTAYARGVVVMAAGDRAPKKPDPIYAESLPSTWEYLQQQADNEVVDFGVRVMDARLASERDRDPQHLDRLSAPAPDAPVLMPAHMDLLCQTAPRPALEPDIAAYLHGPKRGIPEVRICWRADLPQPPSRAAQQDADLAFESWATRCHEVLAICPPSSAESMSVPLPHFRRWLQGIDQQDDSGDVLGQEFEEDGLEIDARNPALRTPNAVPLRYCVIWNAKGCRAVSGSQTQQQLRNTLLPGSTVVIPAAVGGWNAFGHIPHAPRDPAASLDGRLAASDRGDIERSDDVSLVDVASEAFLQSRAKRMLRVHPAFATTRAEQRAYRSLLELVSDENLRWQHDTLLLAEVDDDASRDSEPVVNEQPDGDAHVRRAQQVMVTRQELHRERQRNVNFIRYPGGFAVIGPRLPTREALPRASFDDEHDEHNLDANERLSLADHLADVSEETGRIASGIDMPARLQAALIAAAVRHDLGKADPRFQAMILGSSLDLVCMQPRLWAKSARAGLSKQPTARDSPTGFSDNELPTGFRHEMLSLDFAHLLDDDLDAEVRELMLHVIAAHHGHARPLAPVVVDDDPPTVSLEKLGVECASGAFPRISAEVRRRQIPAHRLDSGIASRFWRLTRRFGWWGLPWLESTLRLADWVASAQPRSAARRVVLMNSRVQAPENAPSLYRLCCVGLNGANPLGLLAALGLLRIVAAGLDPTVRMHWRIEQGIWCPVFLSGSQILANKSAFIDWLFSALSIESIAHPLLRLNAIPEEQLGLTRPSAYAQAADAATLTNRSDADWLSCNGSDLCDPTENSQLQTARRDYFVRSVGAIIQTVTPSHLERGLFRSWDYADPIEKVSLHLEPREDRRHAYQWHKPTGDPTRSLHGGMLGPNRLAMEAWALFPSIAVRGELQTVGFFGTRPLRGIYWTWPLWIAPITISELASLMNLRELQSDFVSMEDAHTASIKIRGIGSVFRLRRILVEKTPNFSPPTALFTQIAPLDDTDSPRQLDDRRMQ